jgi:uncharacterized protein YqfA (UPF0365 family)
VLAATYTIPVRVLLNTPLEHHLCKDVLKQLAPHYKAGKDATKYRNHPYWPGGKVDKHNTTGAAKIQRLRLPLYCRTYLNFTIIFTYTCNLTITRIAGIPLAVRKLSKFVEVDNAPKFPQSPSYTYILHLLEIS